MHTRSLNWSSTDNKLPHADVFTDRAVIADVRDFAYRSATDADKNYSTLEISFESIISVSYTIVPFGTPIPPGGAHAFLSFEIKNQEPIVISFEAQRRNEQKYNPFLGMFPIYRLVGIVGTLRDITTLRIKYRGDKFYHYTLALNEVQSQKLFVTLLEQANTLNSHKIFYNSLYRTCFTCALQGINTVIPKRIGFGIRTLLPGYSASLLKSRGLIKDFQN